MKRYILGAIDRVTELTSLKEIVYWIRGRGVAWDAEETAGCEIIAAELEISEYEVFRRANAWYYGQLADDVDIEFSAYLLSGCETLPYYVNQFTRCWRPGKLAA